jgi:tetratricopeptide (TPR) repeat protein
VDELAAAIAADAERSDRESDSRTRGELADEASRDADACLARAPQAAACHYGRALALGLEAKAHPTRAGELLKSMLESLSSAESADPTYDQGGPARVRGLVLVRAPGWPLGPGDAEAGLAAARRAATLRPQYPPNLLALAEALAKNGNPKDARENYERARDAARALPPSADRDAWLRQADEALQRK